ncbi:Cilia- and flagella-associated protein 57 [Podochytrium sp. JEL0797]|nr:Cilia- and flagella-associated protein 57 [Podochytrium sp. JEL0797]
MSIASAIHTRTFGISQTFSKDNLYYIDEGTIVFPAGSNIVVADIDQKVQKFVISSEVCESISAFSVSADKHIFAVAEKTATKPSIAIYDAQIYRKRRTLNPLTETQGVSKEFTSLAFSSDTKYILAQLGPPEWILHYYAWEKGKILATVAVNPPKSNSKKGHVVEVGLCPTDGCQLSVVGNTFFRIYRYSEGSLTQVYEMVASEGESFLCHSWIAGERIAIGTSTSRILITNNQKMHQTISIDSNDMSPTTTGITSLRATSKGFIAAGQFGSVQLFEKTFDPVTREDVYLCGVKIPLPQGVEGGNVLIRGMAVSGTEGSMILQTEANALLRVQLGGVELKQTADIEFDHVLPAFHHGAITSLDVCIRKPLLISCSTDKSVRIWNYLTGECELCKYFSEEATSVAIHPSGLYVLIGFGDKLRLMNVLIDDFRPFKEFGIRACREACFSNGGHLFAAAHGNIIQLYSVWSFENVANFKGHNGKVRSLYWSPDDAILVSAGTDGAVYSWVTKDGKRDGEYILKNCSYTSAVCTGDGKSLYAVGSDRTLKEITDLAVSCQLDSLDTLTQVTISGSGKMMFAGTSRGCIRSLKFPLTGENGDYQEHQAHSSTVNRIRMSNCDNYLFSGSEDGTIYMFKVADRVDRGAIKSDRNLTYSDEILITKSDLEEKTISMAELHRSLEELKLEHEYQLRLKDMNFNEKIKEKEAKYNQELMEEYEKFQGLQVKSANLQESWQRQMKEYDAVTQRSLAQAQKEAEERLGIKQQEIQKLHTQTQAQLAECQEIALQNGQDIDSEISLIQGRYEKRLRNERDEGARLKGESGIMRKKFNTLNKDIEDNKSEVLKMKDDERKLKSVIAMLEKEITHFKKEMADRDEMIQDKERRVYELKKKNQELEKFKFVLDFRIKELKEQVEPRENEIAFMTDQIQDINEELGLLNSQKSGFEHEIKSMNDKLNALKHDYNSQHRKLHAANQSLKMLQMELHDAVQYIQDPPLLKKSVKNLFDKHCAHEVESLTRVEVEPEVQAEHSRQTDNLSEEIRTLRKQTEKNIDQYRLDGILSMVDNQER